MGGQSRRGPVHPARMFEAEADAETISRLNRAIETIQNHVEKGAGKKKKGTSSTTEMETEDLRAFRDELILCRHLLTKKNDQLFASRKHDEASRNKYEAQIRSLQKELNSRNADVESLEKEVDALDHFYMAKLTMGAHVGSGGDSHPNAKGDPARTIVDLERKVESLNFRLNKQGQIRESSRMQMMFYADKLRRLSPTDMATRMAVLVCSLQLARRELKEVSVTWKDIGEVVDGKGRKSRRRSRGVRRPNRKRQCLGVPEAARPFISGDLLSTLKLKQVTSEAKDVMDKLRSTVKSFSLSPKAIQEEAIDYLWQRCMNLLEQLRTAAVAVQPNWKLPHAHDITEGKVELPWWTLDGPPGDVEEEYVRKFSNTVRCMEMMTKVVKDMTKHVKDRDEEQKKASEHQSVLHERIKHLQFELSVAQGNIKAAEERLEEEEQRHMKSRSYCDELRQALHTLEEEKTAVEARLRSELDAQGVSFRERFKALEARIAHYEEEDRKMQLEVDNSQVEAKLAWTLQKQSAGSTIEVPESEHSNGLLTQIKGELVRRGMKAHEAQLKMKESKEALAKVQRELAEARDENTALKTAVEETQAQLEAKTEKLRVYKKRLVAFQEALTDREQLLVRSFHTTSPTERGAVFAADIRGLPSPVGHQILPALTTLASTHPGPSSPRKPPMPPTAPKGRLKRAERRPRPQPILDPHPELCLTSSSV